MIKQKHVFALTFLGITVFYVATRWYIFRGFYGTDDLHYARLSARVLNHTYSPFVPNDIFCGRMLLIGIQSAIYGLAGISILTTQIGTVFATITSCYLTVFKLLRPTSWLVALLACSFFYFTPVLLDGTMGIFPDAYIMLLGIYFIAATKRLVSDEQNNYTLAKSFCLGVLIGASLLIKEIAIVFLFFVIILILVYKPRRYVEKIMMLLLGFTLIISAIGLYYYIHTRNFFFKVIQINNSDYRHNLSQATTFKDTFFRITYGPWKIFIMHGFYPVVLASLTLLLQGVAKGWRSVKTNYYAFSFVVLLIVTLYLPFSLQEFKLLFIEPRYFLFLLPLAVVICSTYVYDYFAQGQRTITLPLLLLCVLAICMGSTGNKWQWMIYGLITVSFLIGAFSNLNIRPGILLTCFILWISLLETVFFKYENWFKDMQSAKKNISGKVFYFTENENMMHWQLLHQFDTSYQYYNLERNPFSSFKAYNSVIDTQSFKPGWLIVNHAYHKPSRQFQNTLNTNRTNSPEKYIEYKYIEAFYISDTATLRDLMRKIE